MFKKLKNIFTIGSIKRRMQLAFMSVILLLFFSGATSLLELERVSHDTEVILISDELIREMAFDVLDESYRQVSLFFDDDNAAYEAVEKLQEAGYVAVPSDTTYSPEGVDVIMNMLAGILPVSLPT